MRDALATPGEKPRARRRAWQDTSALGYALMAPAFLLVVAFIAYPLFIAINLSLRETRVLSLSRLNEAPIGLGNYRNVLTNPETWNNLLVSLTYVVAVVGPAFLIGLGTALLLNRQFAGRRWLRTLVLIPWAVPGVIASIGFLWILDTSYGVFNYLLRTLGIITTDVHWFGDPRTALAAVTLITIWKAYPFFTLTLLAALQSIPGELYEAAKIDGAGPRALFRYVTWPAIQNAAALVFTLETLWVFREFDVIYATTRGGPAGATETLAVRIYNEAFSFYRMGSASALGLLTLVLSMLLVVLMFSRLRRQFF